MDAEEVQADAAAYNQLKRVLMTQAHRARAETCAGRIGSPRSGGRIGYLTEEVEGQPRYCRQHNNALSLPCLTHVRTRNPKMAHKSGRGRKQRVGITKPRRGSVTCPYYPRLLRTSPTCSRSTRTTPTPPMREAPRATGWGALRTPSRTTNWSVRVPCSHPGKPLRLGHVLMLSLCLQALAKDSTLASPSISALRKSASFGGVPDRSARRVGAGGGEAERGSQTRPGTHRRQATRAHHHRSSREPSAMKAEGGNDSTKRRCDSRRIAESKSSALMPGAMTRGGTVFCVSPPIHGARAATRVPGWSRLLSALPGALPIAILDDNRHARKRPIIE